MVGQRRLLPQHWCLIFHLFIYSIMSAEEEVVISTNTGVFYPFNLDSGSHPTSFSLPTSRLFERCRLGRSNRFEFSSKHFCATKLPPKERRPKQSGFDCRLQIFNNHRWIFAGLFQWPGRVYAPEREQHELYSTATDQPHR